ncbi:MAG: Tetratricopeptide repeat [Blastocatellia bacterium]|nr:Tetratricopeptide repeat [Blastocatellia bacterium]
MSPRWQISAGELFELTRPAAFALSALVSTWTLASARRRGFALYAVAAWTLGALLYPLIVLPIYLIVRSARREHERAAPAIQQPEETATTTRIAATEQSAEPTQATEPTSTNARARKSFLRPAWLPFVYLLATLSTGALLYYRDAQSIDARLSRANRSRLLGQTDRTISEYRAALKLEENAHTRNLLGVELAAAGRLEEALAEFRAAERGNEPDDQLFYRIATTLDALNRTAEAVPEYQKFLSTLRCTQGYPDPQCEAARARIAQSSDKLER